MKKILLIVTLLTAMLMAGHYITITQPDGSEVDCYIYDNGDVDCS